MAHFNNEAGENLDLHKRETGGPAALPVGERTRGTDRWYSASEEAAGHGHAPSVAAVKPETLGALVRELRLERKMTVRGLAAAAGISPAAVSKWESGAAL